MAFIEAREAVPLGAMVYKVRREQELKKRADAARYRLHGLFADECKAQSIPFGWLSFEGDPITALYLATETRDLVVQGMTLPSTAMSGRIFLRCWRNWS